VAIYLGGRVNGISPIGYPLISLFVPLYTGILFFMRGKKEKGIILASLYILMPVLLAVKAGTMTGVVQVILICYSMLCIATAANWFGSDKKKALVILAGEPLFVMTQAGWLLPFLSNGYRLERFKAFFHPEQYQQTFNYLPMKIRDIIASCKLFGKSGDLVTRIPSLNTDYVLLSFFACFGILAGIGVIGLITIFVKRMWVISFQQKNALGFMIGLSISLLMTAQIIIYVLPTGDMGC
jgi:cell division protein FtsW (lipid II flippase)